MRALWTLGTAVVLTSLVSPVAAQEAAPAHHPGGGSEAIIYRDRNYGGPAVNVARPQANMGLTWTVNSIRIMRGTWELCAQPNYRGRCVTYSRSSSNLGAVRVQSMRPTGMGPGPGPGPGPNPGSPGPSLKGMGAEFFTQPSSYGQRIRSCPDGGSTANCARQTAERFCRTRGYNFVGAVSQQTVGRAVYLADVLCRTSAG